MAPVDLDLAEFDAYIFEVYDTDAGVPADLAFTDMPFMEHIQKKGGFVGDNVTIGVKTDYPAGISSSFAKAQTNSRPSKRYKFVVERARHYGVATIDAETIYASQGNIAAFAEALEEEIDSLLAGMGKKAAIQLWGDGGGNIGRILSFTPATKVLTLYEAEDVYKFGEGQTIVVSATASGGAVRAGTLEVDATDPDNATVTFTANVDTGIAAIAADDYLFVEGDYDDVMTGVAGWIPSSAPTATPFWGLDRTQSPHKLAGNRSVGTGMPIWEALTRLARKCVDGGANPNHLRAYISTANWMEMGIDLGDKKVEDEDEIDMGYSSIRLNLPRGKKLRVYGDPWQAQDVGHCLDMSTWKMRHMRPFPHVVRDDGRSSSRQSSSDGIEVRNRFWANPTCKAPRKNGATTL